jgi:hypothetical protein
VCILEFIVFLIDGSLLPDTEPADLKSPRGTGFLIIIAAFTIPNPSFSQGKKAQEKTPH